ncbi:MAG: hypothetical protein JSR00_02715 [Bacteroidetes bacterium]|nr:hypothetical protein [Bacteroidota bacterium]
MLALSQIANANLVGDNSNEGDKKITSTRASNSKIGRWDTCRGKKIKIFRRYWCYHQQLTLFLFPPLLALSQIANANLVGDNSNEGDKKITFAARWCCRCWCCRCWCYHQRLTLFLFPPLLVLSQIANANLVGDNSNEGDNFSPPVGVAAVGVAAVGVITNSTFNRQPSADDGVITNGSLCFSFRRCWRYHK